MKKWMSPILPRGASKYFDENIFRLENYFNIVSISVLLLIYVTGISTVALNMIEPTNAIPSIFSFMIERYKDFESVETGKGAFFIVANIILLFLTAALLIVIASRINRNKGRIPIKITKYNIAIISASAIFIYIYFEFLFFSNVTCSTCGTIASRSLNTSLIIVVITGFYSTIISVFIQISAASIAFRAKEYEDRL